MLRRASEPAVLTRQMRRQLDLSEPVTVAKANVRSRVHRRAYMDYIGVKRFGPDGRPSGETRFVGLFTAEAYDKTANEVPLLRRKVANALIRAGKQAGSHSEKRLKNILENYPRDELFQIEESELLAIALGSGFFKGSVAARLSGLYVADDPRRVEGFRPALAATLSRGMLGQ